jgi:type VI secretion system protein ImpA
MASIDSDTLLQPIAEDDPAGPDLEYDPAYLAAFRAAEGTPERQMGGTLVAAEEPDWRQVRDLAQKLLTRSKDLRAAVLFTRALLHIQGLRGLDGGLALIHGLLDQYWDGVHPRLDPDDNNDPTARVNCLVDLCDREHLLDALRSTPLVQSRVFGPLAYRDIEIAEGRAGASADGKTLDSAAVNGAFQDCDIEDLKEAATAAAGALGRIRGIATALDERIRTDQTPDLDPLIGLLSAIDGALHAHLSQRLPQGAESGEAEAGAEAPSPGQGSQQDARPQGTPGQIASRDDVVRAIDRICDYYARYEPSSPVPLLLLRARRLATGSFVDIVRDLAPDAMAEIVKVCGLNDEP